ncbi:unnamed protein product, partial [marine sediment metagenome]
MASFWAYIMKTLRQISREKVRKELHKAQQAHLKYNLLHGVRMLRVWIDECPLMNCDKGKFHTHLICPECGWVDRHNPKCEECSRMQRINKSVAESKRLRKKAELRKRAIFI